MLHGVGWGVSMLVMLLVGSRDLAQAIVVSMLNFTVSICSLVAMKVQALAKSWIAYIGTSMCRQGLRAACFHRCEQSTGMDADDIEKGSPHIRIVTNKVFAGVVVSSYIGGSLTIVSVGLYWLAYVRDSSSNWVLPAMLWSCAVPVQVKLWNRLRPFVQSMTRHITLTIERHVTPKVFMAVTDTIKKEVQKRE